MFDTLVCGFSDDQGEDVRDSFEIFKGSQSLCAEVLKKTSCFGNEEQTEDEGEVKKDPILQYLKKYYNGMLGTENLDSSTDVGDLSWDEGDLPSRCIKVWTFNDFMEQYNQIYAWLNTIQVQYHAAKKKEDSSPRVESLLKDLEKDVERRERFLRECGRMVGAFPEIEEEVTWRVEHVMAKWDMLSKLKIKPRAQETEIPDIYSDIELEVRCLRKWLKEMEQRIDPLQFSKTAEWSTRDRERKMAEYQVLQTDIESHGRIVKLVLSLCEDLTHNPGLYDLQHAVKVAKGLERRWHQIWLRSLEWQCLLEQWIQAPINGNLCAEDSVFDTDDEPLSKVPKLNTACCTPNFSPAATLLRRKKRKRWINSPNGIENKVGVEKLEPEKREKLISPRLRRSHELDRERTYGQEDSIVVTNMLTSESDPSLTETAPSTSRSETCDSVKQIECLIRDDHDGSESDIAQFNESDRADNDQSQMESTPISHKIINTLTSKAKPIVLDLSNNRIEELQHGYWDSSDEDAFVDNSRRRKVTVLKNPNNVQNNLLLKRKNVCEQDTEVLRGQYEKCPSDEMFSQDSLEVGNQIFNESINSLHTHEFYGGDHLMDDISSDELSSFSHNTRRTTFKSEENLNPISRSLIKNDEPNSEIFQFGEDYRQYINSLSDSSITSKTNSKIKRIKRRTRKRKNHDEFPYESQSEVELEEAIKLISDSQRQIHHAELCADEYISQGFAGRANTKEYDDILQQCSRNVNILFNLLDSVAKGDSFVSQKKCRETRLLISQWEKILQKITDSVNNMKVYEELKDETRYLKEQMVDLSNSTSYTTSLDENEDLETRMHKIKMDKSKLSQQKGKLSQLNVSVNNFLAELGTSNLTDESHLNLAEDLQEDVVNLYSLWESCHNQTVESLSKTEDAIKKLHDFENELLELRSSLQKDLFLLKQRSRKKHFVQTLKTHPSSGDSGISDGSCGILSDYDLPEKHQRFSKLKLMAKSLEGTFSPKAPALLMISRTLEATSNELNDLQRNYMSYKSKKKKLKARINLRVKNDREKFRPKVGSISRRQRYAKMVMSIQLLLMLVLFLSWLCQPRCCDSFSAISFSPQLKYVNGPPPI